MATAAPGPQAKNQYRQLEELFFQQTPGRLTLPGLGPPRAEAAGGSLVSRGAGAAVFGVFPPDLGP